MSSVVSVVGRSLLRTRPGVGELDFATDLSSVQGATTLISIVAVAVCTLPAMNKCPLLSHSCQHLLSFLK